MNDPRSGSPAESAEEPIALDTTLDLLAEERRRCALYQLVRSDRALTTVQLAARVVAVKCGIDVGDVSERARESLRLKLYHIDLPKLADAGIVEFDPESSRVRCTDCPSPPEELLKFTRQYDDCG